MHSILSIFLSGYWTVHFALLASWTMAARGAHGDFSFAGAGLATATAMGLALTGVLFLWMLVTVILEPGSPTSQAGKIERFAFTGATGGLTLMLLNGGVQPGMLMPAVSLQLAALLVSYLVVSAERRSLIDRTPADGNAGVSVLAAGAAHNAMLSRLSGRSGAAGPV